MKNNVRRNAVYAALGTAGGLSGLLSMPACVATGACTACFGCAGIGAVMVSVALVKSLLPKQANEQQGEHSTQGGEAHAAVAR